MGDADSLSEIGARAADMLIREIESDDTGHESLQHLVFSATLAKRETA